MHLAGKQIYVIYEPVISEQYIFSEDSYFPNCSEATTSEVRDYSLRAKLTCYEGNMHDILLKYIHSTLMGIQHILS